MILTKNNPFNLNERQLLLSNYSSTVFENPMKEMRILFEAFSYGVDWFEVLEQLIAEQIEVTQTDNEESLEG